MNTCTATGLYHINTADYGAVANLPIGFGSFGGCLTFNCSGYCFQLVFPISSSVYDIWFRASYLPNYDSTVSSPWNKISGTKL